MIVATILLIRVASVLHEDVSFPRGYVQAWNLLVYHGSTCEKMVPRAFDREPETLRSSEY